MEGTKLAPPWVLYSRKLQEIFRSDPSVCVAYSDDTKSVRLYVQGTAKAEAIEALLPSTVKFGSVEVSVIVIPDDEGPAVARLMRDAFSGNPDVTAIEVAGEGTPLAGSVYVEFAPRVVQYPSDDVSDLHGVSSALMEDLAREVFEADGAYYSTGLV